MTGPLILITLGVLILLNNLDPARFEFGRMWPVILIVIGLVKIFEYFERSGASGEPRPRNRGPRARVDRVDREDSGTPPGEGAPNEAEDRR